MVLGFEYFFSLFLPPHSFGFVVNGAWLTVHFASVFFDGVCTKKNSAYALFFAVTGIIRLKSKKREVIVER